MREAFPKVDLVAAKAAMDHMATAVCVFERRQRMVGQLFIPDVQDHSIVLNYIFASEALYAAESEVTIGTILQPSALDNLRRMFECPGCGKARRSIYYSNQWACGDCLGLSYRSQLVDKDVKLWEERDRLHSWLKNGRPKGMHNVTYMKLRQRLIELERRLHGRSRKYPSDEQDAIVTAKWLPAREIDFWSSKYTIVAGDFAKFQC